MSKAYFEMIQQKYVYVTTINEAKHSLLTQDSNIAFHCTILHIFSTYLNIFKVLKN